MAGGEVLASAPAWIEPVGTLWVNAIRMCVVPLIVALLITSIAGGDRSGLVAKLGGKTIGLFVVMIAGVCVYTFLLAPPLLRLLHIDPDMATALLAGTDAAGAAASELPPFRDWLVSLVPANPLKAAVDTAMLPLLVFTALFAVALLHIEGAERATILRFFTAVKDAMFVLIGWIMLVAPFGIFALVFPLAARMGVSAVTALGSFIVIACSLIVLMMCLLYPLAVLAGRIDLRNFARAVAPVQVVGFSTRSSLASLPATIAATENLGISERVSGLVLPVAVSLFKFSSPIGRIAGTYFVAQLYGIDLGAAEMAVIAMAIGLFSFYSPGIPSGGLLVMAPVYISLGLPVEGIGILIAIDLIIDMFITATNVTANVTVAALLSREDRA
jgi:Na+/H+-dicarboxylate symporter